MAGRSNTELKVFLNGSLTDYQTFCQNPNDPNAKLGSVFFDKTNHTIYVEGNKVVGTQVENVVWDNDDKILTIYPISGAPINVELGVDDALTNLESTLKAWANTEFEAKDATILRQTDVVNDLKTESTTAPLAAAQGKELKRQIDEKVTAETGKGLSTNDYTTDEKNKLAGIEPKAEKNKYNTIEAGEDETLLTTIPVDNVKLMGNLMGSSETDIQAGKVAYNFSASYDNAKHKIYFFNTAEAPTTGDIERLAIADIDATQFIKDGVVDDVSYDPNSKTLTISFNTSSGKQDVPLDLTGLVDTYTAGNGLTVNNNQFSAKLGYGLEFDAQNKIKLYPNPNGGIKVDAGGVALKAATNGGIIFGDGGGIAVDFTKAPVQSVNGQTGAVTIDVLPKVWKFEN